MPATTTLSIYDRASTPVLHDYHPDGKVDDVWAFVESDGVPLGDRKITISKSVTSSKKRKLRIVLTDPVMTTETVNGVARQIEERIGYATVTFTFDESSTLQERKDLVGKTHGLLSESQTFMMAVLEDLQGIYGA